MQWEAVALLRCRLAPFKAKWPLAAVFPLGTRNIQMVAGNVVRPFSPIDQAFHYLINFCAAVITLVTSSFLNPALRNCCLWALDASVVDVFTLKRQARWLPLAVTNPADICFLRPFFEVLGTGL